MRSLADIVQSISISRENGLTAAQVQESRSRFGANELTPLPREPLWKKFLEKFDDPIIKILLAATLLSMVVDLFKFDTTYAGISLGLIVTTLVALFATKKTEWLPSGMFVLAVVILGIGLISGHPPIEGIAVMVAVMLATGVAFYSELKSDREFEVLNAQKDALQVKVQRDGVVQTIPLPEVVVGDLVILEMGDEVPADGRLIKATELMIDQSLMTGESEAVKKSVRPDDDTAEGPDQPACLYRGTQVVDGAGQMIVAEVGDRTMIGEIARRLSGDAEPEEGEGDETPATAESRVQQKLTISKAQTPLQEKLTALAELISKVGYIAAVAIFIALVGLGIFRGQIGLSVGFVDNLKAVLDAFVYMVIIIVVAVPEGLPMSVTVSLAMAMRKMTRANSLVRQLVACETIGSATVICSDKTGTLTQNKMVVDRIGVEGKVINRGGAGWPSIVPEKLGPETPNTPAEWIGLNAGANSTANLEEKDGKILTVGNSTEGSLLNWLRENGASYAKLRSDFPVTYQIHFSSDRKRMTTVVPYGSKMLVLVKGAPEVLLEQCKLAANADGSIQELNSDLRGVIQQQLRDAAGDAMRTLAFAHAELDATFPTDEESIHERRHELETRLVFDGFVAIRDPLRPDVKDAVDRCRQAGIEVKMITGDNIETARAIGRDIGLMDSPNAIALTSAEFNALTDDQVKEQLPNLRILARARPLDKFRMVRLLQEQSQVVAMTGDGTNDAPSLKKADVGLSMGIAGTEVAKEASKIVLLDDSFSTIVKAVQWGRSLYENIQRFIQFQLTINVSALLIAFLAPLIGALFGFSDVKPPFTVLQLLWINIIMDTFAAIALCSEPPREELMRAKPKRRDENIVSPSMQSNILITGAFYVVAMLTLLFGMAAGGWFAADPNWSAGQVDGRQASIFFSVYVLFQVWNQINCRSLTPASSGLWGLNQNPTLLAIQAIILAVQILIMSVPFLAAIFLNLKPGSEEAARATLSVVDWLVIFVATSSVLLFGEIVRRIRNSSAKPV
ncbi:cation-translocating P-type ATPase [Tuwongella immobilis]|uniref:Cation-transporting P-type ATPase N-terminal domain-containing protein n=1 Tax=Tuwongella immobilis TaxID=692036 RepID=A0A6C2YVG4_9BACT|nr:cation-translocating P-type ATPase [Tuwongella immobilis]VIP05738.1 calcium-translocating p-type pmca-type : Calcium-translocating P-type ATPase, PMCA-type OS=Methanospirillum hungatei JF-1 (strain ATCC 27890 / DSM 864 / NBRC 100397 / JF-1) GN=Mhun_0342 PE=4 SV=1: Cation_ATPase_N: E1-E2_ATPase: Hydrolase: Cation_ATPase_C [Tuwongella immobilis]VTS08832.1 calcium-translocating p-type pmca-type : Calcium-translocating P-type ATPase, PMCA-type OS=Methanospirillum hungatei JF-1 (strain ATCC 27890 /